MSDTVVENLVAELRLQTDQGSWSAANNAIEGIKRGLAAVAAAAIAIKTIEWAGNIVSGTVEAGEELEHLSERLGITTDDLGGFEAAARRSGASNEEFATGMQHLARTIEQAKGGSEEAQKALRNVGLTMDSAAVKTGNLGLATLSIADHLKEMPNGAAKTAASMGAMGRSASVLIPLFNRGSDGIREMAQESDDLGAILHGPALDSLKEVKEAQLNLSEAWTGAKNTIAVALAPALSDLASRLGDYLKTHQQIIREKLESAFQAIGNAIETVVDVGGKVIDVFETIHDHLGTVGTAAAVAGVALTAAFIGVTGPIGAIIASIAALSAAYAKLADLADPNKPLSGAGLAQAKKGSLSERAAAQNIPDAPSGYRDENGKWVDTTGGTSDLSYVQILAARARSLPSALVGNYGGASAELEGQIARFHRDRGDYDAPTVVAPSLPREYVAPAAAYMPGAPTPTTSYVTSSPTITVTVQNTNASPQDIAAAVGDRLDLHVRSIMDISNEEQQ